MISKNFRKRLDPTATMMGFLIMRARKGGHKYFKRVSPAVVEQVGSQVLSKVNWSLTLQK